MGYIMYARTVGEDGCSQEPGLLDEKLAEGAALSTKLEALQSDAFTAFGAQGFASMKAWVDCGVRALQDMRSVLADGGVAALAKAYTRETLLWQTPSYSPHALELCCVFKRVCTGSLSCYCRP